MSKITHTQLFQLVKLLWEYSFGYILKFIFYKRSSNYSRKDIIENYVPIQPVFSKKIDINFEDNFHMIERILEMSEKNTELISMKIIDKSKYSCFEKVTNLQFITKDPDYSDEVSIVLDNDINLEYSVKDNEKELISFNGINKIIFSSKKEEEIAKKYDLILTKKPDISTKFSDTLDNRFIAAFLDSQCFKKFIHTVHIKSIDYEIDSCEIYSHNSKNLNDTLVKFLNKFLNIYENKNIRSHYYL